MSIWLVRFCLWKGIRTWTTLALIIWLSWRAMPRTRTTRLRRQRFQWLPTEKSRDAPVEGRASFLLFLLLLTIINSTTRFNFMLLAGLMMQKQKRWWCWWSWCRGWWSLWCSCWWGSGWPVISCHLAHGCLYILNNTTLDDLLTLWYVAILWAKLYSIQWP